jgi:hypothetical protein
MATNLEIIQVSENEIWIGENKTFFLTDLNIIHVIACGEQTTEVAIMQKEINYKLFGLTEEKISYLIDLNKCGKNSPEARQIWNQLSDDEKTNKVAIFGIHPVARVLANFSMGTSKNKNQHFFKTQEEAMTWLLEK